jgi:hypothetical protein
VPTIRHVLRWVLRIGVSLAIIVYILVDVDRRDLLRTLKGVRLGLVLEGLGIYLVGQVLSAIKWAWIGRSVGLVRPMGDYMRFYFIGMFFNLFGLSTIGGDVARALYLGAGERPGLALNSVLFDRLTGLALLMAIGAVALMAFPQYHFPWWLSLSVVGGGLGLVLGWWMAPRLVRLLPRSNRLRQQVETDLVPFWRDRMLLVRVSVLSIVFHFSQVWVQYVLARAAGAEVPFSYCVVFHPILSLMQALPVSVGGFGVREGGYLYFLTRIDVDDSIAVIMGLLWWTVSAAVGLVGAALFMAAGARLPRLRRADPKADPRLRLASVSDASVERG